MDAERGEIVLNVEWSGMRIGIILTQAAGGGDGFAVYANSYYCGHLLYRYGEWQCYVNPNSGFELADVQIMLETIVLTYPNEYAADDFPPHCAFIRW